MQTESVSQTPSAPLQNDCLAVSPTKAALLLGVGKTFFFELLKTGALPSIKIGSRRLITMEALRKFLSDREARS